MKKEVCLRYIEPGWCLDIHRPAGVGSAFCIYQERRESFLIGKRFLKADRQNQERYILSAGAGNIHKPD